MGKIRIKESTTKQPLTVIGESAAYCYGMEDKPKRFVPIAKRCLEEGHGRVGEFANVEIELDGYSAKVIRELYTHIAGTSRLQASTRYIDYSKQFNYVIPFTVSSNPVTLEIWKETMNSIYIGMLALKDLDVPTEDYTNMLPLAYETKMVLKINLRALIHMFNMRACTCAYWEFRVLMNDIKKALSSYGEEWNFISENYFVPKCIASGYCTEEKRHCGMRPKKSTIDAFLEEQRMIFNEFEGVYDGE
ncbi:MAG: FAD-dependent thymidylate synthase [Sarcina sp.]